MKKIIILIMATVVLSACSIKQTIEPAELNNQANVCIVNNPKVKDGFLASIQESLEIKGIDFKVVERDFSNPGCEWKITYTAHWGWDLAVYMTYAKISVYRNGELNGQAEYDSRRGGGRLDKFINADEKVKELMENLIQSSQAFFKSLQSDFV